MVTKADLPPFRDLLKPAIECFKARGGSMTIEEMEEAMAVPPLSRVRFWAFRGVRFSAGSEVG